MTDNHSDEWETEEVDVARPVGVVISTRFPSEVAEWLHAEAARRGVKTSAVVREAVEAYIEGGSGGGSASLDLTISSADAPVTLYTGRSTQGRTLSSPSELVRS